MNDGSPDQFSTCSAMKLSRQELLVGEAIGRALRQVDDGGDARFLRGLGEIDGRMDQAGRDRPDKIGRIGAFHGGADGVDLQEIAQHHFGAELFQRLRPGVPAVHHRADIEPERDRFLDGGAAGVAGGA